MENTEETTKTEVHKNPFRIPLKKNSLTNEKKLRTIKVLQKTNHLKHVNQKAKELLQLRETTKTPVNDAFNAMNDVYDALYGQEDPQDASGKVDGMDGEEDFHYSPLNNIFNTQYVGVLSFGQRENVFEVIYDTGF